MARSRNPATRDRDVTQELGVGGSDLGESSMVVRSVRANATFMEMTHHPLCGHLHIHSLSCSSHLPLRRPKQAFYTCIPIIQRKRLRAREKRITL